MINNQIITQVISETICNIIAINQKEITEKHTKNIGESNHLR